jgi:rare lipoprotein A
MMQFVKSTLGRLTQSRPALVILAATFLLGASFTEASARPYPHHRHFHHFHQASISPGASASSSRSSSPSNSWRDANAAIAPASGSGQSFSGIASFYGNESGSQTASGQRFNQEALTCAHRSLPFGTKLKVTRGDRSVVVTVNDRGPFVRGRVLDLSTAAARELGMTDAGVGMVVAEVQ